jgi:hypothetical protein
MRVRRVVIAASVVLAAVACEATPFETAEDDSKASLSIRFAPPSRPSAAPPAELVEVHLTGPADTASTEEPVDTTIAGAPGDTILFGDLRPGQYALRLEGFTDVFLVWTSRQQVIVLPGTLSEPVVEPIPFEVDSVIVTSSLPLVGGAPLELTWSPVASALDYQIAWSTSDDFGVIIRDTVTTATAATIDMGPVGFYYVWVAPRDSTGQIGYPVRYPDSIEVAN